MNQIGLFLGKVFLSALIIAVVSEVAKRSSLFGAVIASLPLTSLLAMILLYHDGRTVEPIIALSRDLVWLVLPSLVLFILLPWLLGRGVAFYPALALSALATIGAYGLFIVGMRQFGN